MELYSAEVTLHLLLKFNLTLLTKVFRAVKLLLTINTQLYTHTHAGFTADLAGEPESASSPLTLPHLTSYLTPSHHFLLSQDRGQR